MSLKKLSMFQYFDIDSFLAKKKLMTVGVQEWKDFETQNILGTKVEVVIVEDKTDYSNADGNVVNNLYEKLSVKIPARRLFMKCTPLHCQSTNTKREYQTLKQH